MTLCVKEALAKSAPEDDKARERNIVKVIEIEYGPDIVEKDQTKAPHLIILIGGGDH